MEKTDYILCYLGVAWCGKSVPAQTIVQQPLNLNISEGEEIILYVKQAGVADKNQDQKAGSVYLTGYFVEEPTFAPNLDELLEDDEFALEDVSSSGDGDEESDGDEGEGEGEGEGDSDLDEQSLATLLLEGPLRDSDSEDDDFVGDLNSDLLLSEGSINTRKCLAKGPPVKEIKVVKLEEAGIINLSLECTIAYLCYRKGKLGAFVLFRYRMVRKRKTNQPILRHLLTNANVCLRVSRANQRRKMAERRRKRKKILAHTTERTKL